MTDHPVHLAIDLGASGGRVISGGIANDALQMETVTRFPNEAVMLPNQMCWNMLGLWGEIQNGLRQAAATRDVRSIGVATWGVDYVLLDRDDHMVGPAVHYRDGRTRDILPHAFERLPRERLFAETGLQFMEINTAYQLLADVRSSAARLQIAESLLMIPDFFHWLLTGIKSSEMTNASTTQLFDARTRDWSDAVINGLGIPRHLFGTIHAPGTQIGPVQPSVASRTGLGEVPVVLPATHDTGSAVLAVPAADFAPEHPSWCYISSGTWSLIGCELPSPKITAACAELNFTNECGVSGSTRLLKNIGGLWIFQQIRASLERSGRSFSWDEMVAQASAARPLAFLIDPDDPDFVAPDDMVEAIRRAAQRSGQTFPSDEGALFRAALEGLALRYRKSIESLESLTDSRIETIHVVGGGSQNPLLCQMTADACGRRVVAGPAEATAVGNLLMQMIGTGVLGSVEEARQLVRHSFQPDIYEPRDSAPWNDAAERFERLR